MSAFPFDAVIFDMDGVIVDTEYYYLGETAAFAKELGLNLTQEEFYKINYFAFILMSI